MIYYPTFETINNSYGGIHERMNEIRKDMLKYLNDAVEEVGVISLQHEGAAVNLASRITSKEDFRKRPVLFVKSMQEVLCSDLNFEALYSLCQQVREMHIITEYGDPEEEKPSEENPAEEQPETTQPPK